MAGIDTVRGVAFQVAQALDDVIDLVVDRHAEIVVIEGADDVVDYEVLDHHGQRLAVRQAKTRREPGSWGATELARILCAWEELGDADDAEFAFVTDASLNDSGYKLHSLIEAMKARPDEAVLRETATTLGRGGVRLPSLTVLRRVQILTRMGSTEQVLAKAEMRVLNLLGRGHIATLADATNAVNALFRRLFVIGGEVDLKRRTVSRAEVLGALGLDEASLRDGLAWSDAAAESYRAAMIHASQQSQEFLPFDVVSVAATPMVLRLMEQPGRQGDGALPLDAVLDGSSVALIGATGAGKTTTLKYLAGMAAQRGLIPVVLQAAGHTSGALPRRIRHAVEVHLRQPLTVGAVETLLATPSLVLMIDGVSEVDADARDALHGDLERLAAQRPVQIVTTGRDLLQAVAVTTVLDTPVVAYRLTTLNRDSRRQLASAHAHAEHVVGAIEHRLGDTTDNPMLFLMALNVAANGVPGSRAEVYQQFLRGLAARAGFGDEDIHLAAIGAAWVGLIGRGLRTTDHYTWQLSLSAAVADLHKLAEWRGWDCTPAVALSRAQSMGLLVRLDPDSGLAPLHDSFADYLAARAIARGHTALPAVLDSGYDETVLFIVDMAGLNEELAYRLAAENPLLACRVVRLPQAHGVADPDCIRRMLDALTDGCVLPTLHASVGLRVCRHERFTGVVLADQGYATVDNTEFGRLTREHHAVMMPPNTGSLQLAIKLWTTAVHRAQRPLVYAIQPAPPADPEAATRLLPDYLRAVDTELHRLAKTTLPTTVRDRVLAVLQPRGMVAYIDDPKPGPLGGLDVPIHYRRDTDYRVERLQGQRPDRTLPSRQSTLARLMRHHPTRQAAREITEALAALTSYTWPGP
jgi:hypothetical protein